MILRTLSPGSLFLPGWSSSCCSVSYYYCILSEVSSHFKLLQGLSKKTLRTPVKYLIPRVLNSPLTLSHFQPMFHFCTHFCTFQFSGGIEVEHFDNRTFATIARNHLPFFKKFSNFVHFCPNFQIFCPFLPFFLKNCTHALTF